MAPNLQLTYLDRVLLEIIETERTYVRDLRMIVEDYLAHIIDQCDLLIGPEQVCALFGNIEDIYEFNSELLQALDLCNNDAVAVARCFVVKGQFFDVYTQYCTNYPSSVVALTECMRNQALAAFLRERQAALQSALPLGSYLLKPVQRILKYHLLLQEIAKHFDPEEQGYEVVEEAIFTMTGVAWYINDMKRKHEHAIRLQEVQSLLLNWKGPDLTAYGELVLEGTFKVHRAKNERTLFLFERVLLVTKRRGEHFVYKMHICCSTLMLIESAKDSLSFSVTHYKHPKQPLTVQARTVEERKLWAHHIKHIILENHHAIIPQKAKDAIMETKPCYAPRFRHIQDRTRTAASCPSGQAQGDAGQGRPPSGTPAAPVPQTAAEVKTPPSGGRLCASDEIQDPRGGVPGPDGPLPDAGPTRTRTTCDTTAEPAEEPAELEPSGGSELLRTRPSISECPQRVEDQSSDGTLESRQEASAAAESPLKVLSSEESSEDEEDVGDGVEPGGQSPRLLPSSVLDRAGAIAHHFSNSLRRSSLTQEDVHPLSCASPRPHGPASRPEPQETTETVPSPGGDSFWAMSGDPGRRRDSTLSKQDQLLISKIKRYYENAGGQSATFCLQRRESLSSIPAGLVRSSVSRINSIPKVDTTETTSWDAAPGPSAAPDTEDPAFPESSECLDTLRLEESGEGPRSGCRSSQEDPCEEEEFIPSSQMIRIWQTMEQKITLAQQQNQIPKLQEAPQSFMVSDPLKVQNQDNPLDSQEETKSKVLHLARQYSQRIKTTGPLVRQRSQGLLKSREPLACVMEELEKTESSDNPRLDLRNQAGPSPLSRLSEDRPTSSLTCREEVISTDQIQYGCMIQSSSSTEAFDWPDVQHLRSKYSSGGGSGGVGVGVVGSGSGGGGGGGGGGQRRALSRPRSMPESLLVRRRSSCSCLVHPEGPCLQVPSPESGDGRDAVTKEHRQRLQRASSLDLQRRSLTPAEAPQQLVSLSAGGYFVAAMALRPDNPERSVIVMEKVQEAPGAAEENYVQIRSPTSKEKISLVAVVDRCRVYQDSDQSREEAKVWPDGARAPDQESRRSRARPESSRQGRVRNLREKFQNMS